MRLLKAESFVGQARAVIVLFHVKADAANIFSRGSLFAHMRKQGFEHAARTELRMDIDALQPPEISVAPIAPFVSDE